MDRPSEKTLDGFTVIVANGGMLGAAGAVVLIAEVRRLRSLLERIYPHVQDAKGSEDLQAELEREILAIRAQRG